MRKFLIGSLICVATLGTAGDVRTMIEIDGVRVTSRDPKPASISKGVTGTMEFVDVTRIAFEDDSVRMTQATCGDGLTCFTWVGGTSSVILQQPRDLVWPQTTTTQGGVDIEFDPVIDDSGQSASSAGLVSLAPVDRRCRSCTYYPNRRANLETYSCDVCSGPDPCGLCYRCVSGRC